MVIKALKNMITEFLQKNKFFRKAVYRLGSLRAKNMVGQIERYLNKKDKILDIGAGTCNICEILIKNRFNVIPLDVKNLSFVDGIKPIIYDGDKIPFENDEFDVSLILFVLHHIPNSEILLEAKRVSKKIIIIEEIYTNIFNKYLTYFIDSLLNLEFIGHPHTNKTDKEWKLLFGQLGLKLTDAKYSRTFLVKTRQVIYCLEK
ncbi:MAG: SAM-dependent methyltransferase [Parcubacteria group bacterium CG11_big_fil_rev_8_21_14_0_20_39_14]|nr:MAG: SAM-dependent methyltransferase [Parcubacteria group bacterium CG11_big_fil_rev_8_21_14_0_20_39_14]PIS35206.1 MAG: SAM-dependent methyltransferase [Parcubacteria group bacterium CG08_land_8_20_14_0_20_38_56]